MSIDRSIDRRLTNQVLTEITDCMTAEGRAVDMGDTTAAELWAKRKKKANVALAGCSKKYNELMRELREAGW